MPKNGLNVSLNSYDDIFSTEETRQEEQREQVQQIPIDELYPFKDHPFKVLDDEAMQRTVESIKQLGVTNPLIARPRPDGGYEIISGHRRQHAAQLARLKTLPVIVRDMSDDAAVLLMVDSNLQREQILPSERAFAYKMKLDLQTKRQIRNLSKQIAELVNGKSEKMLDISLIDKDLEQLAGILNQYNDNQRQLIASTLRHENYLKESIANISHDLRTPLTVILGHLQLLRKETLTDKQEQRIETIFHKAERMKELVQTFYDLSILDAEQITPRREDFNLSNLLINLITENAPALEAKNISPEIDLPPHSVYLNSDYSMVERILQNLLTNAIRYSSGDIKMGLKQTRKNRAIFTIENPIDSKTEINPARLFERFYTGDASRHNSGTGVGLAVVKLLTDKLGGNVSAEIKSNVLTVTLEIH